MEEYNSISVCLYNENDGVFQLGQRINQKFEEIEMSGYDWDAIIKSYVGKLAPELMAIIKSDPEAGMFSAYMDYSKDNLEIMKKFESYLHKMVENEEELVEFIGDNYEVIEWD